MPVDLKRSPRTGHSATSAKVNWRSAIMRRDRRARVGQRTPERFEPGNLLAQFLQVLSRHQLVERARDQIDRCACGRCQPRPSRGGPRCRSWPRSRRAHAHAAPSLPRLRARARRRRLDAGTSDHSDRYRRVAARRRLRLAGGRDHPWFTTSTSSHPGAMRLHPGARNCHDSGQRRRNATLSV